MYRSLKCIVSYILRKEPLFHIKCSFSTLFTQYLISILFLSIKKYSFCFQRQWVLHYNKMADDGPDVNCCSCIGEIFAGFFYFFFVFVLFCCCCCCCCFCFCFCFLWNYFSTWCRIELLEHGVMNHFGNKQAKSWVHGKNTGYPYKEGKHVLNDVIV